MYVNGFISRVFAPFDTVGSPAGSAYRVCRLVRVIQSKENGKANKTKPLKAMQLNDILLFGLFELLTFS